MRISSRYIQRHLTTPVLACGLKRLSKPIECFDGVKVSVQGSDGHYCSPKSNFGPYSSVEVLYPNSEDISGC